jgi:hypothetical protein
VTLHQNKINPRGGSTILGYLFVLQCLVNPSSACMLVVIVEKSVADAGCQPQQTGPSKRIEAIYEQKKGLEHPPVASFLQYALYDRWVRAGYAQPFEIVAHLLTYRT